MQLFQGYRLYRPTHINIDGQTISSTPGHPFYAPDGGWTNAELLTAEDVLMLHSSEVAPIESVGYESLAEPVLVYNFEVEDWHTYYVGSNAVLVHNVGCKPDPTGPSNLSGSEGRPICED